MTEDRLTKDYLLKHGACEGAISFCERNGLFGIPIEWLLANSRGDYFGYRKWLVELQQCHIEYDSRGNILSKTYPHGNVYLFTYDSNNNMLSMTNPQGNVWSYTYDSNNNLLSEIYPSGRVWSYTYDNRGNRLSEIYPSGRVWSYTYKYWPNGQLKRANDLFIDLYQPL